MGQDVDRNIIIAIVTMTTNISRSDGDHRVLMANVNSSREFSTRTLVVVALQKIAVVFFFFSSTGSVSARVVWCSTHITLLLPLFWSDDRLEELVVRPRSKKQN
jgi:hypothetical protein